MCCCVGASKCLGGVGVSVGRWRWQDVSVVVWKAFRWTGYLMYPNMTEAFFRRDKVIFMCI